MYVMLCYVKQGVVYYEGWANGELLENWDTRKGGILGVKFTCYRAAKFSWAESGFVWRLQGPGGTSPAKNL